MGNKPQVRSATGSANRAGESGIRLGDRYLISTGAFGFVKGRIRGTEKPLRIGVLNPVSRGDPEADGNPEGVFVKSRGVFGYRRANFLRTYDRVLQIGLWAKDQEFLSADSEDHVRFSAILAYQSGGFFEHMIARGMPVSVVDTFEVVDVKHDTG